MTSGDAAPGRKAGGGTSAVDLSRPKLEVGTPRKRVEDRRLLMGDGRYLDDLAVEGVLSLAFARSVHAHADVVAVDLEPARALEGVRLAAGPAELASLPALVPEISRPGAARVARPVVPSPRARFVGEPIALVVADDRYLAEDALDAIGVDYEPLGAVPSLEVALADGAAELHDGTGNVLFREEWESGDVDAAFESAAVVVERTFRHPRHNASPIECRGVLALVEDGVLTVWSSTQIPHILQESLELLLGLEPGKVRVRCPDIGGGFGQKAHVFPEEILVAWAALELGRPVKWVEDRSENLLASSHAREQRVTARAAADRDGRVVALEAEVHCDIGAYGIFPWGQILEALGTPTMMPGPYDVPAYRYRTHAVATNKCPQGAYRGVGLPVAVLVHERMMDLLADELELDRGEIRRRNLIAELPHENVTGLIYDSGEYVAALESTLDAIGYDDFEAEKRRAAADGRRLGLGIACYVEWTGTNSETYRRRGMTNVRGFDAARLAVNPDGSVSLWTSCPGIGQGVETTFRQIAADALGLGFDEVRAELLDTGEAPPGSGSFASRSAISAGGALINVAAVIRRRLAETAADKLEANPDDIELVDGRLRVKGSPRASISVAEAHALAPEGHLDVSDAFDAMGTAYAYATHACVVDVDVDTGDVQIVRYVISEDCGKVINPLIVDGQIHGATAQGIGGALYEAMRYGENGEGITGSFMDYVVPTACEMPLFELHHLEIPAPGNPGGFKGVGEGGTLAPGAALANAVSDALGTEFNELPLTAADVQAAAAA